MARKSAWRRSRKGGQEKMASMQGSRRRPRRLDITAKSTIITDPAERSALIESTVREVALLESERKELGERIRALKSANIKGRLGLKIGDFNASFSLDQLVCLLNPCLPAKINQDDRMRWPLFTHELNVLCS